MLRAVSEVRRLLVGSAVLGAAGAIAFRALGMPIGTGELVAVLVVDASLSAMVAILLPLRRSTDAIGAAASSGAVALFAFFGAMLLLDGAPIDRASAAVLLGLAPVLAALISGAGAAFLARDVRRARGGRPLRPAG